MKVIKVDFNTKKHHTDSKPHSDPTPPPLPTGNKYRLNCSRCEKAGKKTNYFEVRLRTQDPNDIHKLICAECGGTFVPTVITADEFQDTVTKRDKMYMKARKRGGFMRVLNYIITVYFIWHIATNLLW